VAPKDRSRDLKLGPGGLSDVEFLIQRLQLPHGAAHPALRAPGTLEALRAAADLALLPEEAARDLHAGWNLLTRLRQHLRLRSTGPPADLLPEDPAEFDILARSLGLPDGAPLRERCRATTARIRDLFSRHFLAG